jgi:hypothetical protein
MRINSPANPTWAQRQLYANLSSSKLSSFIPVPVLDPATGYGGAAWAQAVLASPDVVEFRLQPISELLTPLFFPADPLILDKRFMLVTFLQATYCQLLPGGCGSMPAPVAHWGRAARTDMPVVRIGAASAAMPDGTIFLFGGSNTSGSAVNNTPLVLAGDLWAFAPAMTVANAEADGLTGSAATVFQGMPVVTGGTQGAVVSALVMQYDPVNHFWINREPLLAPRTGHCAVAVGGRLLVLGGISSSAGGPLATVELYDPATDSWSLRNPMPLSRSQPACSCYQDRYVYVTGGVTTVASSPALVPTVDVYDAQLDVWITDPAALPPPMGPEDLPRSGHVQVIVGDNIFLMGGFNDTTATPVSLSDVRVLSLSQNIWSKVSTDRRKKEKKKDEGK